MLKRITVVVLLMMTVPTQTFASTINKTYDRTTYVEIEYYVSNGVSEVTFRYQENPNEQAVFTDTVSVSGDTYNMFRADCYGTYSFGDGETWQGVTITDVGYPELEGCSTTTPIEYVGESDGSGNATPPDSGGTDPEPNPDDGSGTDTGTGTDPEPDPDGGSGSDPGTGGDDPLIDCPGWDEYMDEIQGIRDAIPPPPNWSEVADTFRDSIVPEIIGDMEDMLGKAPTPPSAPTTPPPVDDGGIEQQEPSMPINSELETESDSFTEENIKGAAPIIPERADPTGGFDLTENPIDSLPTLPTDAFPVPGETDPGEYGRNMPETTRDRLSSDTSRR